MPPEAASRTRLKAFVHSTPLHLDPCFSRCPEALSSPDKRAEAPGYGSAICTRRYSPYMSAIPVAEGVP